MWLNTLNSRICIVQPCSLPDTQQAFVRYFGSPQEELVNKDQLAPWSACDQKFTLLAARAEYCNEKDRESDKESAVPWYYVSCFNAEILEAWKHEETLLQVEISRNCEEPGDMIMVNYENGKYWPAVLMDSSILTDPFYSDLYKEYNYGKGMKKISEQQQQIVRKKHRLVCFLGATYVLGVIQNKMLCPWFQCDRVGLLRYTYVGREQSFEYAMAVLQAWEMEVTEPSDLHEHVMQVLEMQIAEDDLKFAK
jgi:hypothetical protein